MLHAAGDNCKPNVVFIMFGDYGWADIGYNGSRFYETPYIDRLALEGMIFTDGYAAASISSPSHVSLMIRHVLVLRTGFRAISMA